MGHDIWAIKRQYAEGPTNDEGETLAYIDARRTFNLDEHDEAWVERYNAFREEIYAARLHRAAFDPLNKHLYFALDVVEQAYGGLSGNGVELEFSAEKLADAAWHLMQVQADHDPKAERTVAMGNELLQGMFDTVSAAAFSNLGEVVHIGGIDDSDNVGVIPELQFLVDVMTYMRDNDEETVTIRFG